MADETGRFDDRSPAETPRAGSNGDELHAFFTFDLLLLPAALTFGAVDRLRARFGAAAAARFAAIRARDLNHALAAPGCFVEGELEIVAEIGSARFYRAAARTSAKQIAENAAQIGEATAEKIAKFEVAKQILRRPAFAHAGVAAGIVLAAFGGIAEHRVSLGDLFEPLGGVGRRIAVRMIFHRQLAISLLDLLRRGASIDTEHFVVITFLLIGRHGIFRRSACR